MKGDNMTEVNDPSLWWKQAVVYQVYPRSFKDSRGEGLGQIAGVTEKIGYLKELGVDAIWLSPFYPSQLADGGYDVDDYRNVDPKLGTMDDFDALAKAAHADGIKIVVDIVPNHSSNLHEWFKAALAAKPGSLERDRYIFRDGKGPNGDEPPTNWQNHFGGPAWTRVPDGQWYLHMFTKEQPDWNWKNEVSVIWFLHVFPEALPLPTGQTNSGDSATRFAISWRMETTATGVIFSQGTEQ